MNEKTVQSIPPSGRNESATAQEGHAGANFQRRRFLVSATALVGGIGVLGAWVPFVKSMNPSARARAAGAPVSVDFSRLEPGQQITVEWRSKPVWILRRTSEMLEILASEGLRNRLRDPDSLVESQQPNYARNADRAIEPEYLVVVGVCTHLGCAPSFRPDAEAADLGSDWLGGYYCPCHGSRFDLAGRVFKSVPAPTNLVVPPYRYLTNTRIVIGEDPILS